uniref:Uncharacterized protein n=1 Tax=Anguilla anguilla TaxID=7936 RepID=A0A0E9V538_ANGAN
MSTPASDGKRLLPSLPAGTMVTRRSLPHCLAP